MKIPHFRFAAAMAPMLVLLFSGCLSEDRRDITVIEGEAGGDADAGGSQDPSGGGMQDALVTVHPVNLDGSLGAALDTGRVDSKGRFRIRTDLRGDQELVLRIQLGDLVWLALFNGFLKEAGEGRSRPINFQSTLQVAVWLELKKSAEGRTVPFTEAALAVDRGVARESRGEYRGAPAASNALVVRLASAVNAATHARESFLSKGDATFQSRRPSIDSARVQANLELQAALNQAGSDTGAVRLAERAHLRAVIDAYVKAGLNTTQYARSAEAAYDAAVRGSTQLSDSVRLALVRTYARLLAVAADDAARDEYENVGGSGIGLNLVAAAGDLLRADVDAAVNLAGLDSALSGFRVDVRAALDDPSNDGLDSILAVTAQVNLQNLLNGLGATLGGLLGTSTGGEDVGEAYADAQADAEEALLVRLNAVLGEGLKADAAARLLAFLLVDADAEID